MCSSDEQVPDRAKAAELLAFLPGFSAAGREFFRRGEGDLSTEDDISIWLHPEYDDDVVAFFMRLGVEPWVDAGYRNRRSERLIANPNLLTNASYADVRAVLNDCACGERFCDGYWASVLREGVVQAALLRLDVLTVEDSMEDQTRQEKTKVIRVDAGSFIGGIWFIGWLFTIAFAKLIWWQALLALIVWPYYLGLAAR
jgi:hypothetical protein